MIVSIDHSHSVQDDRDHDSTAPAPEACLRASAASGGAGSAGRSRAPGRRRTAPVSADTMVAALRARIGALERHRTGPESAHLDRGRPWTSGVADLDRVIGPRGLAGDGVHEICSMPPGSSGADAATAAALALGFALRLAVRRLASAAGTGAAGTVAEGPAAVVWCTPSHRGHEIGRLYGPGLADLGLPPSAVLLVEGVRGSDVLWAMEEAVRSGAAVLVAGAAPAVDPTSARRLALAAGRHLTPCLLLTTAGAPATPSVASRWRVGPVPGRVPDRSSARGGAVPRGFRVQVGLELCRAVHGPLPDRMVEVEWCDETHRFDGLADVVDRVRGATGRVPEDRSRHASGSGLRWL